MEIIRRLRQKLQLPLARARGNSSESGFLPTAHCPLPTGPWLYRWAVFTVCATFVLLALGAVVTTFHVGMADPIWPTYPWHLLLISWDEPKAGFLIEHTHRLAGYIVGCCTIVLTVGLYLREPRAWVRRLGVAALVGVIIQGLLGGFRVKLNEWLGPDLALIHGCFAQVVFALLVSLALVTARGWSAPVETGVTSNEISRMRLGSVVVTGVVYVQIVFGSLLRHTYSPLGQRGHLLAAFAVAIATSWLAREVWDRPARAQRLIVPVTLLAFGVVVQLFLGVEAWMLKYVAAGPVTAQALVRTVHVLTGSLVLALAVVAAWQAHRPSVPSPRPSPLAPRPSAMEGVR